MKWFKVICAKRNKKTGEWSEDDFVLDIPAKDWPSANRKALKSCKRLSSGLSGYDYYPYEHEEKGSIY